MADGLNVNVQAEIVPGGKARLKPWTKRILCILAAGLGAIWIFGDAPIYIAMPSSGRIVDASTGKPIQGAVVVAEWIPLSEGFGQAFHLVRMKTLEVVSDNHGDYRLDGWGPKLRVPFQHLDGLDPQIIVFKPGYYPARLVNSVESASGRSRGVFRTSNLDGQLISLKPFDRDWEKYSWAIVTTWSPFYGCMESCPHLVGAIVGEGARVAAEAPHGSKRYPIVTSDELPSEMQRVLEEIKGHDAG